MVRETIQPFLVELSQIMNLVEMDHYLGLTSLGGIRAVAEKTNTNDHTKIDMVVVVQVHVMVSI